MIKDEQLPDRYRKVIEQAVEEYEFGTSITVRNSIPDTSDIPLLNPGHWLRIPDVIAVFVDMKNSTKLSATNHDRTTAAAYQLFTKTAVTIFNEFDSPYIDVHGDGVFALFNQDSPYRALAAAVTFKTFSKDVFEESVKNRTNIEVGAHIGIDQKTVLVRKLGLKRHDMRTDRQNEVWAGKPVNMASKLASIADKDQLIVSDRYYSKIRNPYTQDTCGCPNGIKVSLWKELDLSQDGRFDFDKAYILGTKWCPKHGREYCEHILSLDK